MCWLLAPMPKHLAQVAGQAHHLHLKVRGAVGGVGVGRPPVGHDDGGALGHEIRALPLDGLADQRLFRVNVAVVDELLQKLEAGAHVVAVLGLPAVQRLDLLGGVAAVVQVGVGDGKDEYLQPPAVGPHRGLVAVLLEHLAAFQEFLRGVGGLQPVFFEQVHVEEETVGHHLLGDGHQFAVHRVGHLHNLPEVFGTLQAGKVGQLPLLPQYLDDVRVQQVLSW